MLSEPKANSSRAAFDSYSYSINPKLWYGCPVDAPASEAMRIVDSFDTWRRESKMDGISKMNNIHCVLFY